MYHITHLSATFILVCLHVRVLVDTLLQLLLYSDGVIPRYHTIRYECLLSWRWWAPRHLDVEPARPQKIVQLHSVAGERWYVSTSCGSHEAHHYCSAAVEGRRTSARSLCAAEPLFCDGVRCLLSAHDEPEAFLPLLDDLIMSKQNDEQTTLS